MGSARAALPRRAAPLRPLAASAPRPAPKGAAQKKYRMRDLCALTGLERQTIHFYIQEGLLPEGHKTGRNMAYYGDLHLERLRMIKKLQEERFLPLRAIRAVLGGKAAGFSDGQRQQIAEVKTRLLGHARGRALVGASDETVTIDELADAHGVPRADVEELISLGLVGEAGERGASRVLRRDSSWWVGVWADLRRAGLSRERGFSPRDLLLLDEALSSLFDKERELFFARFDGLPPDEVATVLERVLPIVSDTVGRIHAQKARDFFTLAALLEAGGDDVQVQPERSKRAALPAASRATSKGA